jgi:hypothetical protein
MDTWTLGLRDAGVEPSRKDPDTTVQGIGWRKAAEIVKVGRRDGEQFDGTPWVHKAKNLNREEFEREVEKHLPGKESEPWELIYSKVYNGHYFGERRRMN